MLNKKEEEVVVSKDIHGWKNQAEVAKPAVANNPFPAENPNVSESMVSVEGDKKSDEVLLALTKKVQSKEEFRVKFSVGDSGAYQYYGCVIALRNGQVPLIKSNEVLIDAFREISTAAQLKTLAGLDEKLNGEYFDYIVALRGAK